MATDVLWLTEADVAEAIDLGDAITAIEQYLLLAASREATTMRKTQLTWGDGNTLHAIGGAAPGAGLVGTKTWSHTRGGATPLLVLWDSEHGGLRAVVEAFALGQLRTAAVTAVATRLLSPTTADTMAIIGTGKQALPQVAAVGRVRPLREVRVYSPTAAHREAFAERLVAEKVAPSIELTTSVGEAAEGAAIVTIATRSHDPVLSFDLLHAGAHVNAIGAIGPGRRELDRDVLERAQLIVADDVDVARQLSDELEPQDVVMPLQDLATDGYRRRDGAGPTVFKAMGIGLADVAVGAAVLSRAEREGRGRPFAQPTRAQPRLIEEEQ